MVMGKTTELPGMDHDTNSVAVIVKFSVVGFLWIGTAQGFLLQDNSAGFFIINPT